MGATDVAGGDPFAECRRSHIWHRAAESCASCANRVVAGVRYGLDLPIRPQVARQSASAHRFTQLEGLAIR